ncbi:MAG: tetratricopeptide repeat protein [Gemmatimonadota bacterium]
MAPGSRLQDLTAKYMQNPRRYFVPLANEHLLAGDLDGAIALCREHLPAQPGHMSGHIVLGRAYFEKGDLDAARDVFMTSVSLDDENLIALRHLGDIARGRNEVDDARGWYARVLDADPQNAEIEALLRSLDPAPAPPVEFDVPDDPGFLTLSPPGSVPPLGGAPELGSALADPTPPGLRAIMGETDLPTFDPGLVRPADPMPPSAARTLETFDLSTLGDEPAVEDAAGIAGDAPAIEFAPDAGAGSTAADFGIHAEEGVGFGFDELDSPVDPTAAPSAPDALPAMQASDFPSGLDTPPASTSIRPTPSDEVMARPGFGALASFASWRTAQERDTPTYVAAQPAPAAPPTPEEPTDDGPGELFWDDRSPETAPTAPEFVTETMASLYQQQGFTQQALDVYRALLTRTPGDPALTAKVLELEALVSRPADETALEEDADKALQFDDLDGESSGQDGDPSMLETMYDVSPPAATDDRFGAAWAPSPGDDWFAPDAELDPIGEPVAGPGDMFGVALDGFASDRDGLAGRDANAGASSGRAAVVLETVFGAPTVATADEAAADMMVRMASQMVGRLPKEAPTLPVPEVLELPSAVAGDQATGASPAPLLSFDRFFSGSGSPPRPRIDTPIRPTAPPRDIAPPPTLPSPSLSPTFGGVPVIPPPRSTPAPNWAGFDQFLTPSASAAAPLTPPVTPTPEPVRPPAPVQPGAFWTPPELPTQAPSAGTTPTPAAARPTPAPMPVAPVVQPPAPEPTEPEAPRAAPSEFHRWLEGLS